MIGISGMYFAPEPVVRYKSTVELERANGSTRKLHVSIGARNFREARNEAIKSAVNYMVSNFGCARASFNPSVVSGATERMEETRKRGLIRK